MWLRLRLRLQYNGLSWWYKIVLVVMSYWYNWRLHVKGLRHCCYVFVLTAATPFLSGCVASSMGQINCRTSQCGPRLIPVLVLMLRHRILHCFNVYSLWQTYRFTRLRFTAVVPRFGVRLCLTRRTHVVPTSSLIMLLTFNDSTVPVIVCFVI